MFKKLPQIKKEFSVDTENGMTSGLGRRFRLDVRRPLRLGILKY